MSNNQSNKLPEGINVNTDSYVQIMRFLDLIQLEKMYPNDQEFGRKARTMIKVYNESKENERNKNNKS